MPRLLVFSKHVNIKIITAFEAHCFWLLSKEMPNAQTSALVGHESWPTLHFLLVVDKLSEAEKISETEKKLAVMEMTMTAKLAEARKLDEVKR